MICHHCGRDNPDDEMFCLACGEALRAEPDEPEVVLPEPPQQPVRQEPVEEDYGETEPYFATKAARRRMQREQEYRAQEYYPDRDGGQLPARRRKSRAPFLIVSHLTAFIAALCFWLPFREWVSFHYSLLGFEISDGRLTLSELAKRFYDNRGILSLVTGTENEYLSSMIPDYVNEQYAQGRVAALVLAIIFLVSLVLYALFILSVLFHLRGSAATFGILASLLYWGATIGAMYGVKMLNSMVVKYDDYSWNLIQFKLLEAPYVSLGLAALIIVLCIVFAILGRHTASYR